MHACMHSCMHACIHVCMYIYRAGFKKQKMIRNFLVLTENHFVN